MKVAYDVPVPHNQHGGGKYSKPFWQFFESEHESVKFMFTSTKESEKAYKAMYEIIGRNPWVDVKITKIENAVYLKKGKEDESNSRVD